MLLVALPCAYTSVCQTKTIVDINAAGFTGVAGQGTTTGNGPQTPILSNIAVSSVPQWTNIPSIVGPNALRLSPFGCTTQNGGGFCVGDAVSKAAPMTLVSGCMVGALASMQTTSGGPFDASVGLLLGGTINNVNGRITTAGGAARNTVQSTALYQAQLFFTYNYDGTTPAPFTGARIGFYGRTSADVPLADALIAYFTDAFVQCPTTCTDSVDVSFAATSSYFFFAGGLTGLRRNNPIGPVTSSVVSGVLHVASPNPLEVTVDATFDASCTICTTIAYVGTGPSAAKTVCLAQNHRIPNLATDPTNTLCTTLQPNAIPTILSAKAVPVVTGETFIPGVTVGVWMPPASSGYHYEIHQLKVCNSACVFPTPVIVTE